MTDHSTEGSLVNCLYPAGLRHDLRLPAILGVRLGGAQWNIRRTDIRWFLPAYFRGQPANEQILYRNPSSTFRSPVPPTLPNLAMSRTQIHEAVGR